MAQIVRRADGDDADAALPVDGFCGAGNGVVAHRIDEQDVAYVPFEPLHEDVERDSVARREHDFVRLLRFEELTDFVPKGEYFHLDVCRYHGIAVRGKLTGSQRALHRGKHRRELRKSGCSMVEIYQYNRPFSVFSVESMQKIARKQAILRKICKKKLLSANISGKK